jgi:hypothetical protein
MLQELMSSEMNSAADREEGEAMDFGESAPIWAMAGLDANDSSEMARLNDEVNVLAEAEGCVVSARSVVELRCWDMYLDSAADPIHTDACLPLNSLEAD